MEGIRKLPIGIQNFENLAKANGMGHEECVAELKRRYDGYHFAEFVPGMYNPYRLGINFSGCLVSSRKMLKFIACFVPEFRRNFKRICNLL